MRLDDSKSSQWFQPRFRSAFIESPHGCAQFEQITLRLQRSLMQEHSTNEVAGVRSADQ